MKEKTKLNIKATWKIPWTEEPGGLPSMGSHRVGHNGSDLAWVTAPGSDGCSHVC